jgi:nickel-type superoxide dismutase maturation protease
MFMLGLRRVIGDSMTPTLAENDLILVIRTKQYRVGDVVGFVFNKNILVKRISEIKNSQYYVLGDNQKNSLDSRKLGWLNNDQIVFKVIHRF